MMTKCNCIDIIFKCLSTSYIHVLFSNFTFKFLSIIIFSKFVEYIVFVVSKIKNFFLNVIFFAQIYYIRKTLYCIFIIYVLTFPSIYMCVTFCCYLLLLFFINEKILI